MASYRLLIRVPAAREIEALPKADRRRVVAKISALAEDPRPAGSEKLSGREQYRVRQGNYRVVYEMSDREVTVVIVRVGNRRDVYR